MVKRKRAIQKRDNTELGLHEEPPKMCFLDVTTLIGPNLQDCPFS